MEKLLYLLYCAAGIVCHALLVPAAPVLRRLGGRYAYGLDQRLGRLPRRQLSRFASGPTLWVHASSVGEVQAAVILIRALLAAGCTGRFVLTTTTWQGQRMAQDRLGAQGVVCRMAPLDVYLAVQRTIRWVRPDLYIGLETELWPLLLTSLGRAGIPFLILNGRLSARSFSRYRRVRSFMRLFLRHVRRIGAISAADAERFVALGAPADRVQVCGNLKYDMPAGDTGQVRALQRRRLAVTDQKVLVCGSTHPGEEEQLIPVFMQLAAVLPLVWVLAPRHVERVGAVGSLLSAAGLPYVLYSQLTGQERRAAVVLVDTIGDLADLYCGGDYIFCGGSLVPMGGHNLLEAARWGRPVYFGPHVDSFQDAADLLLACGGGFIVADADELASRILYHQGHPEAYLAACSSAASAASGQRGAVDRQTEIVMQCLADLSPPSGAGQRHGPGTQKRL
ncbi:MAG: 3-deoxy-D-manno-octulosonic acid transferase [Desulfobulbus sp.]